MRQKRQAPIVLHQREPDWPARLQPRNVHCFVFEGLRLVLDVCSGAVHSLDEPAWDLLLELKRCPGGVDETIARLGAVGRHSPAVLSEALAELQQLVSEGSLGSSDEEIATSNFEIGSSVVKAICLNVAHDCNLCCTYCFAGSGRFGGEAGLMPVELGLEALNFLVRESGDRPVCEVDFFGGEPLLNFDVVRKLVVHGRRVAAGAGKAIKFSLTTNALCLGESEQRFLNDEGIQVVLSLDGRPEVHDRLRKTATGEGSYSKVAPNIVRFVTSRTGSAAPYYVRGTYTRYNLDFCRDVVYLADLGFKEVSLEPVVAGPDKDYALRAADLPLIFEQYAALAREYLHRKKEGRGFNFYHFQIDLSGGPCLYRRLSGCGAGFEYLAVTPTGELYPCHQFVGRTDYYLGNVWGGLANRTLSQSFREVHVYNIEACRACWARFYCSGGCRAQAVARYGSLGRPEEVACAIQRYRLECALYIQASQVLDGLA